MTVYLPSVSKWGRTGKHSLQEFHLSDIKKPLHFSGFKVVAVENLILTRFSHSPFKYQEFQIIGDNKNKKNKTFRAEH